MSIGSLSNDFATPGVEEYALRLESQDDAKNFHHQMLNAIIRAQAQSNPLSPDQLHVAIIGAGATDRKSTRLNSSHLKLSRMPSSA